MSTEKYGLDVFTAISLCSGYEGLGIGLKRAIPNLRTVCYVENEAFAVANLVAKIREGLLDDAPIWDDIKDFDAKPFTGMVDIIHSGFPCQPFSVAGQRKGTADPRHLWPYIAGIVQSVRPLWCFFENVPGHLTVGFAEVYRSLRLMGYSVEAGLFTAAECGAPHRRQRLFILAYARSSEPRRLSGCQWQKDSTIRGTSQLAYRSSGGCEAMQIQQAGQSTLRFCSGVLADTENTDGRGARPQTDSGRGNKEIGRCFSNRWPARPGQEQYEWEEPRTVGNTGYIREGRARRTGQVDIKRLKSEQLKAQSRLGRAVDGSCSRVDRLRLLGNGVVPQQAEKAFRTLMGLFEKGAKNENRTLYD